MISGSRRLPSVALLLLTCALLCASASSAFAATPDPDKVGFTLEGCRLQAGETLPNGSGKFVCPDADYTTGNLGKLWNELDLVPYRLTAASGKNTPQTYAVAIALDNCDAGTCAAADLGTAAYGHPGYDVIGSDGPGGTPTVKSGGCSVTDTGQLVRNPGVGGTQSTIYRILTITQPANATCVFDWYGRLALGSHLYPGSSLHANLLNQSFGTSGIGSKEVSIPVKEIEPQELSVSPHASQDQDYSWNVTKEIGGDSTNFPNPCDPEAAKSGNLTITVSWTRTAVSGVGIVVTANVSAHNPAHRLVNVTATDTIKAGATPLDTKTGLSVPVPGGSTINVLTHTFTVPGSSTNINGAASATYIDDVTHVPVPGTTNATWSIANGDIGSGSVDNATASLSDTEKLVDGDHSDGVGSILSSGADFAVSSVDTSAGVTTSFEDDYTLGTYTAGPVTLDTNTLTGSGSIVIHKTVRLTDASNAVDATLYDAATLTPSGSDPITADAARAVTSPGCGTITIKKETNPDGSPQEFTFSSNVPDLDGASMADGGSASGSIVPGTYSVSEDALKGWELSSVSCSDESSPDEINLSAGEDVVCTFHNTHLAAAVVITKVVAEDHAYDGDTLHYTITVSNLAKDGSNGDATDVNLSDLIQGTDHGCAGLSSSADSGDSEDPGVLNVDETWVFHCTYVVQHADENASHQIINVATVTATDTDGSPLGPKSAQAVTPVYHPAINIDKSGPETAQAGDKVPYILTVTNPGDESFAEATMQVTDDQCNGDPVTLIGKGGDQSTGSFDPGDVWTYTCSVQTKVGDTAIHNVAVVVAKDQFATAVSAAAGPGVVTATDPAETALAQPAQIVLPARIVPGAARLTGPTGCTAKAFNARIRGTKIATVTFLLDGKVVKRVKNNKATSIALRINPAKLKLGVHRLVVNVTFQSGSGTKPKTMRLSFQRCGKKLAAPRFTG